MAEVLHVPDEVTTVRSLDAPGAVLDPATERIVAAAVAEAEARARREGEAAGRAAAAEEVQRAVTAVSASLDELTAELRDQRELATSADLRVVEVVAAAVLGRTPPDDALALLERVREAAGLLDADHLEVRVHPADHALLVDQVHDTRLRLVADPSVAAGESIVGTSASGAELTRRALLDAALRVVAEEGAS